MNSLQLICETQVKNGLEVAQNIYFLTLEDYVLKMGGQALECRGA